MNWKTIAIIAIIYIALVYLFQNITWGKRWNMSEAFTDSVNKLKKKRVRIHRSANAHNQKKTLGAQEHFDGDDSSSDAPSNEYDSEHESELAKKQLLEHMSQMQGQSGPIGRTPAEISASVAQQHQAYHQTPRNPANQDMMAQNLHENGPLPLGSFDVGNSMSTGDMDLGNLETFNGSYVSMGNHYNSGGSNGTGGGNPVESVNYYPSDEGIANFESNAYDIKKFFKVNSQHQVERELQQGNGVTVRGTNRSNSPQIRKTSLVVPDYHNPPTQWNYENELVMNGAPFVGNVTPVYSGLNSLGAGNLNGYQDDISSQYETFNISTPNSDITNYNYDNLAPKRPRRKADDLRMGMGKPAAPIRAST